MDLSTGNPIITAVSFVNKAIFGNWAWWRIHAVVDGSKYTVCNKLVHDDNDWPDSVSADKPKFPTPCGFCMADIDIANDKRKMKRLPPIINLLVILDKDNSITGADYDT